MCDAPTPQKQKGNVFSHHIIMELHCVGKVSYSRDHELFKGDFSAFSKAFLASQSTPGTKKSSSGAVSKAVIGNLVLNRLQIPDVENQQMRHAKACSHVNVEKILEFFENNFFYAWITIKYQDTLENALASKRVTKANLSKPIGDVFEGLKYLILNSIRHGYIHERNLAYDGENWYIGDVMQHKKLDDAQSGEYGSSHLWLKSRRAYVEEPVVWIQHVHGARSKKRSTCGDDLWQLILVFASAWSGANPFHVSPEAPQLNVCYGRCQIFDSSKEGLLLRDFLLREHDIVDDEYDTVAFLFNTIMANYEMKAL